MPPVQFEMDRASIARLANSCKNPLGRVGKILEDHFIEQQREHRHSLARSFIPDPEYYASLFSEPQEGWYLTYLEEIQIFFRAYARRLTEPQVRCIADGCRTAPHRFATWGQCPIHHGKMSDGRYW